MRGVPKWRLKAVSDLRVLAPNRGPILSHRPQVTVICRKLNVRVGWNRESTGDLPPPPPNIATDCFASVGSDELASGLRRKQSEGEGQLPARSRPSSCRHIADARGVKIHCAACFDAAHLPLKAHDLRRVLVRTPSGDRPLQARTDHSIRAHGLCGPV